MSAARKCEFCGGYYDQERFKVSVSHHRTGATRDRDCCSVACIGALAERLAQDRAPTWREEEARQGG